MHSPTWREKVNYWDIAFVVNGVATFGHMKVGKCDEKGTLYMCVQYGAPVLAVHGYC